MASSTTAGNEEGQQPLWALVPFGARSPITKPVFFNSPEEVKRCWSTPIFVGRNESKVLETRADWLKAIESDVPAPIVLSLGEELARAFSKPEASKSTSRTATAAALYEQWLAARTSDDATAKCAEYVLGQYGFTTYRLYMSIDKNRAARILRKHGSEAFLQFMNCRRRCLNPLAAFVQSPAPVHRLCDDHGPICNLRLSEYIRPSELNLVSGDFDTFLHSCLAHPLVPYMYCLHPDWKFSEIQRRAKCSPWHQAPKRKLKIENAREYFARVALELDAALRDCRPSLSATALQAFWTSWEVSEHLKEVERGIEEYASEPGAVSADIGELGEAQSAIESIIRHYVMDCLEEADSANAQVNEVTEPVADQPRKRGRKSIFTTEILEEARQKKQAGHSNNEVAKVLYRTLTPSADQRRSVPTILKYHGSKN
jgi:hypothetical protein